MQGKVEICGVNTAKLGVLSAKRMDELLMQANVDFLFFDTTNAAIYRENATLVMRILQEYHDEGWKIPQVMFYTNTASGLTVLDIYDSIY